MNIFSSLTTYAASWSEKSSRKFTNDEINCVERALVVPSQYGNSVCFIMKAGGKTYIPLDRDSQISVGDSVDLREAKLVTLSKSGSSDINRVRV